MDKARIKDLLDRVSRGDASVEEALEALASLPFRQLEDASVDTHRSLRLGYPEVIFGERKTPDQVVRIAAALFAGGNNVLATRITTQHVDALSARFGADLVSHDPVARCVSVRACDVATGRTEGVSDHGVGRIAIVSAGTSDLPVAKEAAFVARALGNNVEEIVDVGVAGVHRLLHFKEALREAFVLIVVAGMEGALPSVVGGLVSRPVIAVPTSVGYGASFGGLAALLAMLNSCAPGVTVVNIDNGFGAAYAASLINRKPEE